MFSTIEDIYVANIDTDRGQKEKVRFIDTAGIVSTLVFFAVQQFVRSLILHWMFILFLIYQDPAKPEVPRHYFGIVEVRVSCFIQNKSLCMHTAICQGQSKMGITHHPR